jgi:hypothetical protein
MRICAILFALALPFPAFAAQQPAQPRFVLEDGTPVKLVLAETISSADQHKGNLVIFSVAEDVKVGNVVVIPKGANAWGTITMAKRKGRVGRGGRIEVSIDRVRLADGEKVALSAIEGGSGDNHQARMATAIAVTGVVAWPTAPLFLLMQGKDVSMPEGARTMAFVHGDNTLDPARFTPDAIAAANDLPAPPATAPASSAAGPSPASAPVGPAPIAPAAEDAPSPTTQSPTLAAPPSAPENPQEI